MHEKGMYTGRTMTSTTTMRTITWSHHHFLKCAEIPPLLPAAAGPAAFATAVLSATASTPAPSWAFSSAIGSSRL